MKNAFKTLNTPFMNANMLIACMLPFADRAAGRAADRAAAAPPVPRRRRWSAAGGALNARNGHEKRV